MSILLLIYIIVIFFIFSLGVYFLKRNMNSSGLFFLFFSIFLGIWFFFYFLSFSTNDINNLYLYSKITYSSSILLLYSFLFFLIYYGNRKAKFFSISNMLILIFFLSILFIYNFTPFLIEGMYFDESKNHYYEEEGNLYIIHLILSLIFIPLLGFITYFKFKTLSFIKKMRLKYILLGLFFMISSGFFTLLILPIFGIRILEKEFILFAIPFLISLGYSINKYYFIDLKIGIGKLGVFSISIFYTIFSISIIKYYMSYMPELFYIFWGFSNSIGTIDLIFAIILYIGFYNIFNKIFLGKNNLTTFENNLNSLKKYISYIFSVEELKTFLQMKFKTLLKVKYINIKLFNKDDKNLEIFQYFSNNILRDLFINDIVFIEENKYKFNYEKINKEISQNTHLILPIVNNKNTLIGLLELGHKPFKDIYSKEEIDMLKGFRDFITGHLKYIKIYSQINNLNKNLDKQVDQKTLEINNLLNKQKEFISMASHEIKTPLAGAIMQSDVLLDEIEDGNLDKKSMKHEVGMLIKQLEKVGSLVNNIFKVQKYDIKNIQMFFEIINIKNLLKEELLLFQKMHPKVDISLKVEDNISYIKLDKIQFTQVLDNLLNNSLKYSEVKNLKIVIKLYSKGKYIYVEISDNGKGLINIDLENIFDKYFVGPNSSFGIGMGLYLCKKIVSMHEGVIKAKKSVSLGGASFIIKLPK